MRLPIVHSKIKKAKSSVSWWGCTPKRNHHKVTHLTGLKSKGLLRLNIQLIDFKQMQLFWKWYAFSEGHPSIKLIWKSDHFLKISHFQDLTWLHLWLYKMWIKELNPPSFCVMVRALLHLTRFYCFDWLIIKTGF